MGMCKKCYKKEQCSERDQYGRCTQYRRIDEIRKEIEDLNRSSRVASSAGDSHDQAPGCPEDVDGDQARGDGLLLG